MAVVIPSRLPVTASTEERQLHRILQTLPEDVVVYAETGFSRRHPHFVLLLPTLGVVAVEVRTWHADEVVAGDAHFLELSPRNGAPRTEPHPSQEAWGYLQSLLDLIEHHPLREALLVREGPRQGGLICPVNALVVLPHLSPTAPELDKQPHGNFFPPGETVGKDDLQIWERLAAQAASDGGRALLEDIAERLELRWEFPPLDPRVMNVLRSLVHPEIKIADPTELGGGSDAGETLAVQVLDLSQEDLAVSAERGHHVVHGVTGSGKTQVLIARAKRLRRQNPAARLLVLCHNRTLSLWLRDRLAGTGTEVRTFHSWAWRNGVRYSPQDTNDLVGEALLELLEQGRGEHGQYDAILVDEGQDFEPDWFRCLLLALKEPDKGDLFILTDGSQSLYPQRSFQWSEVGIQVAGGTVSARPQLSRNYRNSPEITALASLFAGGDPLTGRTSPVPLRGVSREWADDSRALPVLRLAGHREAEEKRVAETVRDWLAGRWLGESVESLAPEEIAILYPGCHRLERWRLERLIQRLDNSDIPVQWVTPATVAGEMDGRNSIQGPGVKLQTIHSSKGLQYRAVIIMWLDLLPDWHHTRGSEAELADRRLLYIALTRAEKFLCLVSSQRSRFVREIEESSLVRVLERNVPSSRREIAGDLVALPA